MSRGRRITAPDGWGSFGSSDILYFLFRTKEIVTLIEFYQLENKTWRTHFKHISAEIYEKQLSSGSFVASRDKKYLPPWFPPNVDFDWSERRMRSNVKWVMAANAKYGEVKQACDEIDKWIISKNPESQLNKYAAEISKNTARFRVDVLTYLIFGPEISVLQPRTWNCGKYDRGAEGESLGRKMLSGEKKSRRLSPEDKGKFKKGYMKYRGLKKNMVEIHCEVLVSYFDVKRREIVKDSRGYKKILSSSSRAVPTINQFRYWAKVEIGADQIYRDRFGRERSRNRQEKQKGGYSEECANLMEVVERDAYFMREIPRGIECKHQVRVCVVHIVDRVCSGIVGIGFSHGGEKAEAYRMAEFCAAIDKSIYCRLMGVEDFDQDDWPMIGIPPDTVTDRGPGSKENIQSVFAELTPSYSPQSKPTVESSNPKDDKISGKPVFIDSELTTIELMRMAIRNAIEHNATRNIGDKIPNRMIETRLLTTPSGLWREMDSISRNNAMLMSFESAVRTYLNRGVASVIDIGLKHRGQPYFSTGLLETELLNRIGSEVEVYYMPMNLRQIWVETEDGLLEVRAILAFQDSEDQLYVTELEAVELSGIRNELQSKLREHKAAVAVQHEIASKNATGGKGRRPGKVVGGKPNNKTAIARREKARMEI